MAVRIHFTLKQTILGQQYYQTYAPTYQHRKDKFKAMDYCQYPNTLKSNFKAIIYLILMTSVGNSLDLHIMHVFHNTERSNKAAFHRAKTHFRTLASHITASGLGEKT